MRSGLTQVGRAFSAHKDLLSGKCDRGCLPEQNE
jgi:hypothetical protein